MIGLPHLAHFFVASLVYSRFVQELCDWLQIAIPSMPEGPRAVFFIQLGRTTGVLVVFSFVPLMKTMS